MKKTLLSLITASALLGLSGCQTMEYSGEISCPTDGGPCTIKGKVKGSSQASILRPVMGLLASTGLFTYTDWNGMDVSTLELEFQESQSNTIISSNTVTVKAINQGVIVGSKIFDVYKVSNKYKFSNPELVKAWAQGYIESADSVDIDFEKSSSGNPGATTTAIIKDSNQIIAATTFVSVSSAPGGGGNTMIQ